MTVNIWVLEEVEVPAEALPDLASEVREKFELEPEAPVYLEDLLHEGARRGVVSWLPAGDWRIDDEWSEPLPPEEIQELVAEEEVIE